MTQNTSLKFLMLEEDSKGQSVSLVNIGGETFQAKTTIDKKGINLELVPVNPEGTMIHNLSEDEVQMLDNSLMTSLAPKFAKYKMQLDNIPSKGGVSIKMHIPIEGVMSLIKAIIQK